MVESGLELRRWPLIPQLDSRCWLASPAFSRPIANEGTRNPGALLVFLPVRGQPRGGAGLSSRIGAASALRDYWVMFQRPGSSLRRRPIYSLRKQPSLGYFPLFMVCDHCQKIPQGVHLNMPHWYYYMRTLGETFMINQVFRCPLREVLMEKYIWRKLFS